jgi:predicted dehydrogenase
MIDAGVIGDVKQIWCRHFINYGGDAYFKDWHSEKKYSNSLLLQKGAHDIDVIHWLANSTSTRVVGMGSLSVYDKCERRDKSDKPDTSWKTNNYPPLEQKGFSPNIDVEDQSMVLMTLENGIQASYLQNHFTPDACRNYCIIGTKGRLENYGNLLKTWTRRIASTNLMDADETIRVVSGSGGHGGADQVIVDEFLNYIRNGGPTTATPIAARNSVAVGCQAAHSMRNGNIPMDIPGIPAGVS